MKKQKGQLSLQFNWIFVIFVGAIILAFFLMMIKNQTKSADFEMAGELIKNLDTIIKSAEQSTGTVKPINIPASTKINFVCEPGLSFYDLGNGITKDIPYQIIFAQAELKGTPLISWTQSWDLPMRISFFQYLTTKGSRFIVVNDTVGTLAEKLYDWLPKNITIEIIQPTDTITDTNHDYYKVIEFEGTNNLHTGTIEPNVHKLTIRPSSDGLDSHGEVQFDGGGNIGFLKKEALFGAIFAEDEEFYTCTMEKAFARMKTLMEMNERRLTDFEDLVTESVCASSYSWTRYEINNVMLNKMNVQSLYQSSKKIERDNSNLMRAKRCPLIY